MIDKSKQDINEIQTIHDQLLEQNRDLVMESDNDMPPVTIEKVQIQQDQVKLPDQTKPSAAPPAEKEVEQKKPEESGFKQFMRKWFKITW